MSSLTKCCWILENGGRRSTKMVALQITWILLFMEINLRCCRCFSSELYCSRVSITANAAHFQEIKSPKTFTSRLKCVIKSTWALLCFFDSKIQLLPPPLLMNASVKWRWNATFFNFTANFLHAVKEYDHRVLVSNIFIYIPRTSVELVLLFFNAIQSVR